MYVLPASVKYDLFLARETTFPPELLRLEEHGRNHAPLVSFPQRGAEHVDFKLQASSTGALGTVFSLPVEQIFPTLRDCNKYQIQDPN